MRRLVDVVIVVAIVGLAVTYGPSIIESLREDAGLLSEESVSIDERDPRNDRDLRDAERTQERVNLSAIDAQAGAIEQQIEQLKQGERDCYAASKSPGGTGGRCRMYADRIRAAEARLRALKRQ